MGRFHLTEISQRLFHGVFQRAMNGIPELTRDVFGKDSVGMGVRVGVVHKDQIDHDHHEQDARSQSDAGKRGGSGRQIIAQRHRF